MFIYFGHKIQKHEKLDHTSIKGPKRIYKVIVNQRDTEKIGPYSHNTHKYG